MNILLDNNAIDKLANNIEIITKHPEIQFFICYEAVMEVSNNKTYNPTRNVATLLKLGVKYVRNSVFILGYSRLNGESTFCDESTSTVYKRIANNNPKYTSDAIIAATAVKHKYTLLTDDSRLYKRMKEFGYAVMKFSEFINFLS